MTATKRREPEKPVVGDGMRPSRNVGVRRHRAVAPEEFKTSVLTVRVKDQVKSDATAVLSQLGISMPEAVRVFLGRIVAEQAFPFPLEKPIAETARALRESLSTDYRHSTSAGALLNELVEGCAR